MGLDLHDDGGFYTCKTKVSTTSVFHAMSFKVKSV